jgi:hypothetical protein
MRVPLSVPSRDVASDYVLINLKSLPVLLDKVKFFLSQKIIKCFSISNLTFKQVILESQDAF